jgi:hypothetical protein
MPKKNKMWDNSNLQEDIKWGNIELPGVSDETLLTTNWNHKDAVNNYWNSPQGKQQKEINKIRSELLNKERLNDPEYKKRIVKISTAIAKNPERNKKLSKSSQEFWNSEKGKQTRSQQQKKNWQENYETMSKGLKERFADGKLGKKISERLKSSVKVKELAQKQSNEIHTPDGIFPSRKAAAEFYGIHPTGINRRLSNDPKNYYYTKVGNGSTGYKTKK